jgi:hypothetical protein
MSAKSAPANSVCLNHPDRPAATRCTTCFKPICAECVVRAHGEEFCSSQCSANYDETRDGVERFQEQNRKRRAAQRRRRLVILIILGVAAYFAYRYYRQNPNAIQELKQKSSEMGRELKNKAESLSK